MRHSVYIVLLFAGVASAGEIPVVPLVNIDPAQTAESSVLISGVLPATDESWGWAFTVPDTQDRVFVTHVAWYDTDGDGLSHSHPYQARYTARHECVLASNLRAWFGHASRDTGRGSGRACGAVAASGD
jgi:hypothetical protein